LTDLTLYKDKALKIPFTIEELGDVDAGDIKIIEGYLMNDSRYEIIRIEPVILDEDVSLIDVPDRLDIGEWKRIHIKYSPKNTRTEALQTFVSFYGKKRIPPE